MYHRTVKRQIRTTFDRLNQHQVESVVAMFQPDIIHSFGGNHALGGVRHSQALARAWYGRLFRLFPDLRFQVQNIVVAGLPQDTRIAVQFRVALTAPDGSAYHNDVAQFIRLRWGKIAELALYEDTDKLVHLLHTLAATGIEEAVAPAIVG